MWAEFLVDLLDYRWGENEGSARNTKAWDGGERNKAVFFRSYFWSPFKPFQALSRYAAQTLLQDPHYLIFFYFSKVLYFLLRSCALLAVGGGYRSFSLKIVSFWGRIVLSGTAFSGFAQVWQCVCVCLCISDQHARFFSGYCGHFWATTGRGTAQ